MYNCNILYGICIIEVKTKCHIELNKQYVL